MKVSEIYNVLSAVEDIQIINAKSCEPYTSVDYLADSGNDFDNYKDYTVYGLSAGIDNEGGAYIKIIVEEMI